MFPELQWFWIFTLLPSHTKCTTMYLYTSSHLPLPLSIPRSIIEILQWTHRTTHMHFFILFSIIHYSDSSIKCQLWHNVRNCINPHSFCFASDLPVLKAINSQEAKNKQKNPTWWKDAIRCTQFADSFTQREKREKNKYFEFIYDEKYVRKWHRRMPVLQRQWIFWCAEITLCIAYFGTCNDDSADGDGFVVVGAFSWNHCVADKHIK